MFLSFDACSNYTTNIVNLRLKQRQNCKQFASFNEDTFFAFHNIYNVCFITSLKQA